LNASDIQELSAKPLKTGT